MIDGRISQNWGKEIPLRSGCGSMEGEGMKNVGGGSHLGLPSRKSWGAGRTSILSRGPLHVGGLSWRNNEYIIWG